MLTNQNKEDFIWQYCQKLLIDSGFFSADEETMRDRVNKIRIFVEGKLGLEAIKILADKDDSVVEESQKLIKKDDKQALFNFFKLHIPNFEDWALGILEKFRNDFLQRLK